MALRSWACRALDLVCLPSSPHHVGSFLHSDALRTNKLGRLNLVSNYPELRLISTSSASQSQRGGTAGFGALLQNYKQLSKAKLSALVVLTSAAGYVAGSGDSIKWAGLGWTCIGTFAASACANTLNQLYEVVNDSKMTRTANRPLPSGRLTRMHAAGFALVMGAAGITILYEKTNTLTACLGASNIALYAGIYTPLKQITIANTWIGALVGAIPPLMGWAAASGSLDAGSMVLAAALFSWQMPHFLSLAWFCKEDYIKGGFQMLSKIDPQGGRTAMAALRHCAYLAPVGLLAYLSEVTTWPFAVEAAALSAFLGVYSMRFAAGPSQQSARKLFKTSLLYLPLLMAAMAVHRLPNNHAVSWEELGLRFRKLILDLQVKTTLGMDYLADTVCTVASRIESGEMLLHIRCPSKVQCRDSARDSNDLMDSDHVLRSTEPRKPLDFPRGPASS